MKKSSQTHEQTINTAFGEVLHALGRTWRISSEQVGGVFEEDGGRPDILINKTDGWPIIIEAEVGNHRQAELEAKSRLGKKLILGGWPIHAAFALVYPRSLRNYQGAALRHAIGQARFEYCLFSLDAAGLKQRFPASGWLSGGIRELALLIHRSSVPAWRVEALADTLETGVRRAEGAFSASHPAGSALGKSIAALLGQSDDEEGQTRRMAMTVVVDALIFHSALSEAELAIRDRKNGTERQVRPPGGFRARGAFRPTEMLDEWENILSVNYWPIFHTASSIIRAIVPTGNPKRLTATANRLILAPDERSLQVDLVRLDRTVPAAGCVGSGDPCPSTPTQRAAEKIPEAIDLQQR